MPCCPANWEVLTGLTRLRKLQVPWVVHGSRRLRSIVKKLRQLRDVRYIGIESGDRIRPPTDTGLHHWSDGEDGEEEEAAFQE